MNCRGALFIEVLISTLLLSWGLVLILHVWHHAEQEQQRLMWQFVAYQQHQIVSFAEGYDQNNEAILSHWAHLNTERLPDAAHESINKNNCHYVQLSWQQGGSPTNSVLDYALTRLRSCR